MTVRAGDREADAPADDDAGRPEGEGEDDGGRSLSREERHRLGLLGLPTLALALAITVVSTYGPTVAHRFTTSNTVIGLLIGAEGLGALLLPLPIGAWSDRLRTRWGGRLPFVAAGTPVAVVGLVGLGFVGSLGALAAAILVFFVGYFIAYEPYRALYPDLVPDEVAGRAQSTQALFRGTGTVLALLGGGLLLSLGRTAPFLVAAVLVAGVVVVFAWTADPGADRERPSREDDGIADSVREVAGALRHDTALRAFFLANALWELALAALKTFVILWLTRGLGVKLSSAALLVGAVAVFILVGALGSGKLADRFGTRATMACGAVIFGLPMFALVFTTSRVVLAVAAVPLAIGGGVLLSLPYALLQPLMPEGRHGLLTGFYSASRGIGVMLGPLIAGLAITAARPVLSSTQGYSATWAVCGVATLASLPLLRRVRDDDRADGATAAIE